MPNAAPNVYPLTPINPRAGALWAVRRGLPVLPVKPNSKEPFDKDRGDDPVLAGGVRIATTDPNVVESWFRHNPAINYGIAMGGGLVALDCDAGKPTFQVDYVKLDYPATLEMESRSGGAHIVLRVDFDAGQKDLAGASSINVRARGGYIVGPGSVVDGKRYKVVVDAPIADCPSALAARLSRRGERAEANNTTPVGGMDTTAALAHAYGILAQHSGVDEGNRDNECFRVACRLKDEGVSEPTCVELLGLFNAEKVHPPLADADIERIVDSAYRNGQRPPGVANPQNEFEPVADAPELREWGRRLAARGEVSSEPTAIKATPFVWRDPSGIPRRDWIYGRHLIRKFVSATVAAGGAGKSSLVLIEALSIVTGRALLTPHAPKPGKVWLWNGEDPAEELERRIHAALRHYGIGPADIKGRLFVDSGRTTPIVIATEARDGTKINAPVVEAVKATIRENAIDVFIVDPFVSSHRVSENDNNAIEAVAWQWAMIADECNCAIELVHHTRKTGGAEATAEDARGASALGGKARSVRVVNGMTKEEGGKAGITNHRLYFRVDDGKANMSPPSEGATWYRLQGVGLGNGTADGPEDDVGVVVAWSWPDPFDGLPDDALARALAAIDSGKWRADMQAKAWAGIPIAKALGLDRDNNRHREQVKGLIKDWLKPGGPLEEYEDQDEKRNVRTFIRPRSATP